MTEIKQVDPNDFVNVGQQGRPYIHKENKIIKEKLLKLDIGKAVKIILDNPNKGLAINMHSIFRNGRLKNKNAAGFKLKFQRLDKDGKEWVVLKIPMVEKK